MEFRGGGRVNGESPKKRLHVPRRPQVGARRPSSAAAPPQAPIKLLDEEPPKSLKERLINAVKTIPWSKRRLVILVGLLLIVGYAGTHWPKGARPQPNTTKNGTTNDKSTELPRNQTPKFKTVLPAGKTIDEYGGWTRISPPDRDAVFAYPDKLAGIPITVSEQPLPGGPTSTTEEDISKIASDFQAKETLKVEGITVHIGTSSKGPQSVIFTKNGQLILIKTTSKISNEKWAEYISSLE
jgi:hypothetical protein